MSCESDHGHSVIGILGALANPKYTETPPTAGTAGVVPRSFVGHSCLSLSMRSYTAVELARLRRWLASRLNDEGNLLVNSAPFSVAHVHTAHYVAGGVAPVQRDARAHAAGRDQGVHVVVNGDRHGRGATVRRSATVDGADGCDAVRN